MRTEFGITPGRAARRRVATALAVTGALLLSSGLVVAASSAAVAAPEEEKGNQSAGGNQGGNQAGNEGGNQGGADKVTICHRKASDRNPYVVISVADDSTVLEAHKDHQVDDGTPGEDKYWGSAGVWNGVQHAAGDFRPDFFLGGPNPPGFAVPETLEEFAAWCVAKPGGPGPDAALATVVDPLVVVIDTCGRYGAIVPASDPGGYLTYSISGGNVGTGLSGSYVVTATLASTATGFGALPTGWRRAGPDTATRTVDVGDYYSCTATLADVTATPITACGSWGAVSRPADDAAVAYAISGGRWTGLEGAATVTATLQGGATGFGSTAGWAVNEDGTASKTFQLGRHSTCGGRDPDDPGDPDGPELDRLVVPRHPFATDATCSRDGRLRVPRQPAGVLVDRSGSVPGVVTIRFTPAQGFAFPEGTDTQLTVTVPARLQGADCIKGVETVRPEPRAGHPDDATDPAAANRGADPLGAEPAALPTAVAAGITHAANAPSTASPRLALALVAGGLLMLVVAGTTGLRRPGGLHES